jgi:hypothetical protein
LSNPGATGIFFKGIDHYTLYINEFKYLNNLYNNQSYLNL